MIGTIFLILKNIIIDFWEILNQGLKFQCFQTKNLKDLGLIYLIN